MAVVVAVAVAGIIVTVEVGVGSWADFSAALYCQDFSEEDYDRFWMRVWSVTNMVAAW